MNNQNESSGIMCYLCNENPAEVVVPSDDLRPRPLYVCQECGWTYPTIWPGKFPILHFRNRMGFWFFIFIDEEFRVPYTYTFDYKQKRPRRIEWHDSIGCPYPGEDDFNGFVDCLFPYKGITDVKEVENINFSNFSTGYDGELLRFQTGDGRFHQVAIDHDHFCPRLYTAAELGTPFEGDVRNPYALDWNQVHTQVLEENIDAYFAYGADINFDLFKQRYGEMQAKSHERAVLFDYRLSFSHNSREWRGGVLDLQHTPGECVEGVIYRVGSLETIINCHRDNYEKVELWVESQKGPKRVIAVVHKGPKKMFVKPSTKYMDIVQKGARMHEFTPRYQPLIEGLAAGYICSYLDGSQWSWVKETQRHGRMATRNRKTTTRQNKSQEA